MSYIKMDSEPRWFIKAVLEEAVFCSWVKLNFYFCNKSMQNLQQHLSKWLMILLGVHALVCSFNAKTLVGFWSHSLR